MLTYLFIIGLANFALGAALAVYLRLSPEVELFIPRMRIPRRFVCLWRRLLERFGVPYVEPPPDDPYFWMSAEELAVELSDESLEPAAASPADDAETQPVTDVSRDDALGHLLAQTTLLTDEIIDTALRMLSADAVLQRERILEIERQVRRRTQGEETDPIAALRERFLAVNDEWGGRLLQVAERFYDSLCHLGERREAAKELADHLFDQASHIQSICRKSRQHATDQERTECQYLMADICALADAVHAFRDYLLPRQSMFSDKPAELLDEATGLLTRAGFERKLEELRGSDKAPHGPIRVAMLDLDRFNATNIRQGVHVGDQVLSATGRFLQNYVGRWQVPIDAAVLSQGRYLLLFSTQSFAEASLTLEKIRQMFEAATFSNSGADCLVTTSCGLIETNVATPFEEMLTRLRRTIRSAKLAGRNRTALEEKHDVRVAKPAKTAVQATLIPLPRDAALSSRAAGPPDPSRPTTPPNARPAPAAAAPAAR